MQREQIIADYQAQLTNAGLEKKTWKDREAELRTEEGKAIQSVRKLASDEVAWTNKKRGYEGELKRWAVESEKQQKINSTYQGLTKDSQ